jgi:hypothetical protein
MKKIFKYPLEITAFQTVKLPLNSEILTVQNQFGTPCIWAQLWVLENPGYEERIIEMFGIGQPINNDSRKYLGTVQMDGGALIWHVFERI